MVALYCSGAVVVALRLHKGWSKTVLKMDLSKDEMLTSKLIGHAMIAPLCAGFAIIPIWLWAIQ